MSVGDFGINRLSSVDYFFLKQVQNVAFFDPIFISVRGIILHLCFIAFFPHLTFHLDVLIVGHLKDCFVRLQKSRNIVYSSENMRNKSKLLLVFTLNQNTLDTIKLETIPPITPRRIVKRTLKTIEQSPHFNLSHRGKSFSSRATMRFCSALEKYKG